MEHAQLLAMAEKAKVNAWVPYSGFHVGAALETDSGKIYTGCNVENISYGATNCAERTAVFKMVSEGEHRIRRIAVASDLDGIITPCGICRQVLAEFGGPETEVIMGGPEGQYKVMTLNELLPEAFREF